MTALGGHAAIVAIIALAVVLLVGFRPRGIPEWIWAVAGAIAVVVLGLEPPRAAAAALGGQWNVLLFLAGLMGLSVAAETSGLFAWLTDTVLDRAGGSRRRLFIYLFLAAALFTVVLSNDATAIVLTPVVYRIVARRGIDALPYLYACSFAADTASFGLPFSNPANVLVVPRPHLGAFLLHLGPPMLAAVVINLLVFIALFGTRIRGRYDREPAPAMTAPVRRTLICLGIVVGAYIVALLRDVPLGPVATAGALVTLVVARTELKDVAVRIGWTTLVLLAGLFVVLDAVSRAGFLHTAQTALTDAARHGRLAALASAAFGSAVAANLLNNLPVAVLSGGIVAHATDARLAYPLVAGVDLGPNLTTAGSLATILWLSIVRERGYEVRPMEYLRLGIAVVPAMLAVTVLWLWLVR